VGLWRNVVDGYAYFPFTFLYAYFPFTFLLNHGNGADYEFWTAKVEFHTVPMMQVLMR
jgi:hypothetical protein